MTPARSEALRRARQATLSLETSSSDTSSGSSSDSASYTLESSFTASLEVLRLYYTYIFFICWTLSEEESVFSYIHSSYSHTTGALSLTRADLLPPHKRYRGTSAMHSDESGNEGSPETYTESDMDSDIRADIKAETATAATKAVAAVDGLDI
ncbi:hypothetical protein Tco_0632369 [Tanacetum coccineum]